jgi:hypothetical protein
MAQLPKICERCGIAAHDTPEGFLAMNGLRLVCSDCNSDLDDEYHADSPSSVHPIDALNHTAHVAASLRRY